ncbi:MAG: hypothetical protein PWP52_2027 [Bacteroidales bacterium]|nr:hypothetical protein [Bacteroidales bacterium]
MQIFRYKMWKNFLFIIFLFLAACSLKNQKDKQNDLPHVSEVTNVKFDTLYHNFGNLIQGEQVAYTFNFKNIGSSDLWIKDAYSTCGCTVAKYTQNAVPPESSGYVEVIFDSSGRRGVQYKNVVVQMNTKQGKHSLYIRANVIKK